MDSLSIVSINVNGLRNSMKRKTIFRLLKQKKFDFICLQETFILDSDKEVWEKEWGGKIMYSPGTRNSKGQVILQRKGSEFTTHDEKISDRIVTISFMANDRKTFIINAYAPTVSTEKHTFFLTLDNHMKGLDGDIILCGDFNCVLDNELDIISGNGHRVRDVEDFQDVIVSNSLNDTWRLFHPDEKEFTWSCKNPFLARRLDYIFTSDHIFNSVNFCNITSIAQSDHRLTEIQYRLTKVDRGPSYWKFNDSLLKDQEYLDKTNKLIEDHINESSNVEPQFRWDFCKIKIREFTIRYSKAKAKLLRDKKKQAELELNDLDIQLSLDPLNHNLLTKREKLKQDIEIHNISDAKSAQIRSRVKFIEEGEKNTKFFLGLEKARANAKIMDSLKKDNGEIITKQDEILKEQFSFYSNIYKKKREFNQQLANNFCDNLNIPKLSDVEKNALDKDISIEEIGKALSTMKNNSAPGNDGLTYSFLKVFWIKIGKLIFDSFRASYQSGELSFSQRQSIITLIHKGKELPRDELTNWRPISLSNTDYKLLAKCISIRLALVLPNIISEDQVGFVKGRNSSTLIRIIDDTIETLKINQTPGILLAVDYKRAFDSISKDYMLYAFKSFGFGEGFMKWVKILLANTESCINYLGWISERFSVDSGIKQGCPFSPMAFIIGLELLAIKIRQDPNLKGVALPVPLTSVTQSTALKILLYADDMSLFLHDHIDLDIAMNLINQFSVFSNLEINTNKTEAMWLGSRAGCRDEHGGIKWKSKLKILGIFFSNQISASLNNDNWNKRINRIKELIILWSKRNLSITGKLCIIKTFLISQIIYVIQSLSLPDAVLNTINTLLFRFLWKKKHTNTKAYEKIKRAVICNTHENGGINMINIKDMQSSFLLSWAIKLMKSTNEKWSIIPRFMYSYLGQDLVSFKSNLDNKTFIGIDHIRSEFWKTVLITWLNNKDKLKVYNNESFKQYTDNCLWNNTNIRYRGNCLNFRDWSRSGINFIEDIKPLQIKTFQEVVQIVGYTPSRQFEYNALCTALNSQSARNLPTYVNQNSFPSFNKTPSAKEIRTQIISNFNIRPCAVNFWERKLNVTLTPAHWLVGRISTKEERLRLLHFKLLHNIYPTNILLHKMGLRDNNMCPHCRVIDYVEHFFFSCEKVKRVWSECQNYIYTTTGKNLILTEQDVLLGYKVNEIKSMENKFINHLILITKMVISKYKYGTPVDITVIFQKEINIRRKFLMR